MNKIPCDTILDLLPSYIDGLTSQTTNQLVEEHMDGCADCKQAMENMKHAEAAPISEKDQKEIDFLKKNRKKNLKVIAGSLLAALLIIGGVLFTRLYIVGDYLYGDWITCDVKVDNRYMTLNGTVMDSVHGVSTIRYEEKDGVVTGTTKAVLASPFHKGEFSSEYAAQEDIVQVRLNDRILWDKGKNISKITSEVYQTGHEYMGDMPANNQTAQALRISEVLGSYSNELLTGQQPYGWKIVLEQRISSGMGSAKEKAMRSFAYVMLSVIDNLDEVIYEYQVEGTVRTLTVTAEEASAFAGHPIKDCGKDVSLLQELIEKAGLNSPF